jgi:hypothetical protein
MAKGSRPEDETTPRSAKRRRRPPVLELKATEVGSKGAKTSKEKPKTEREPETTGAKAGRTADGARARAAATDWRVLTSAPAIAAGAAGVVGLIAGALIVFLVVFPRTESADPRVGDLAGEVANLSARIESLASRPIPAPAPDQSGLAERIDKLTAAIGEAEQRLAAVEQRPEPKAPDFSAVDRRTAAIEESLQELRGGLADLKRLAEQMPAAASPQSIEGIAGRIGGLEERIAQLAAARAAAPTASPARTATFVAMHALTGAVRSGKPFATELDRARTQLGNRVAPLAALEPLAATGLPTVSALERQFAELTPRLLRGPEANGNFFERLLTNASRLVEVRRVGEPEGDSASAIVARAETKLARGDLAGAIGEVESMPEPGRSAAADWLEAARQRRDAETLIAQLLDASLTDNGEPAKP